MKEYLERERYDEKYNWLTLAKSPYLKQHEANPVNWLEWRPEAFVKAEKEDKPIFLSIGYSTCHWCHVMERESFENQEVADILNRHFIAIKVDREERPDLDQVYMTVCQAMTGQGGWPLTIIMTPDKKPFFAGTYFPPERRYGRPGLMELLQEVARLWQEERERLLAAGTSIVESLQAERPAAGEAEIKTGVMTEAYRYFLRNFDREYGGFGAPPKFPSPHQMNFLLRYWRQSGEKQALAMVEKTLEAMYRGGIYDHIGFGFCRYSTDRYWLVPHFEKMLYDNALLIYLYTEAYQCTLNPLFARVVEEIITYIEREMTGAEGGFYTAQDADSEGVEGKYYLWEPAEILVLLGEERGRAFCQAFDITAAGNFEGKSIPNLIKGGPLSGFEQEKSILYRERRKRIPPFKDDKILTAWNGLMIAALALAGRVWQRDDWLDLAEKSTDFIFQHLVREDGRLLARYREGEAQFPAYLDDYAYLTCGLLELYLSTFKEEYLRRAEQLAGDALKLFWAEPEGGFYFYGHDSEELFLRPREIYDQATPAGNGVMAVNLWRLAAITGEELWQQRLDELVRAFAAQVNRAPMAATAFLQVLWLIEQTPLAITFSGPVDTASSKELWARLGPRFLPELVITLAGAELPPGLHICHRGTCQPPTSSLNKLIDYIEKQYPPLA